MLFAACSPDPSGGEPDTGGAGDAEDTTNDVRLDTSADVTTDSAADTGGDVQADAEDATGQSSWESIAPLGNGPRQETAVVELGGHVYVIGGYTDSGSLVSTVEVYDPSLDSWSEVASVPDRLHHANAAVYDGKIYVLGYLGQAFAPVGRCFVYDPDADDWTELGSMPGGRERGSSAIATIGDKIYVAGGLSQGAVDDVSSYDPETDSWTELTAAPRPFDHAGYGAIDGKLVVAGGRDTNISAFTDDVDIYDPTADAWTSGAAMPTARGGVAAAVLDGELFVIGGEGHPDNATGVFDDVEAYDLEADSWRVLDRMPDARHGMGAATVGDRIIVPGGADREAFAAVDTSSALTP